MPRRSHPPVSAVFKELLHPTDDLLQSLKPFHEFFVKLLMRPAFRKPAVEVAAMWHSSDRNLGTGWIRSECRIHVIRKWLTVTTDRTIKEWWCLRMASYDRLKQTCSSASLSACMFCSA